MGKPSAPSLPAAPNTPKPTLPGQPDLPAMPAGYDPATVAGQALQYNQQAAEATKALNAPNFSTPFGSLATTPQGVMTLSLDPQQQQLLNEEVGRSTAANERVRSAFGALGTAAGAPFSLENAATEARLMELGRTRLDPILQEQTAALDTRLRNQGVMPGSEAYDRAMAARSRDVNDAYNQLLLGGRQQAVGEAVTGYLTPIQAQAQALQSYAPFLRGATLPTAPANLPPVSVGAPNIADLVAQLYSGQITGRGQDIGALANMYGVDVGALTNMYSTQAGQQSNTYNQQVAAAQAQANREAQWTNALYGAIGGIGGAAAGGWAYRGFPGAGSIFGGLGGTGGR